MILSQVGVSLSTKLIINLNPTEDQEPRPHHWVTLITYYSTWFFFPATIPPTSSCSPTTACSSTLSCSILGDHSLVHHHMHPISPPNSYLCILRPTLESSSWYNIHDRHTIHHNDPYGFIVASLVEPMSCVMWLLSTRSGNVLCLKRLLWSSALSLWILFPYHLMALLSPTSGPTRWRLALMVLLSTTTFIMSCIVSSKTKEVNMRRPY